MMMAADRHVLLVTDAFPPVSGGSGWSTYELARGLRAYGARVTVLRPRPGTPAGLRVVSELDVGSPGAFDECLLEQGIPAIVYEVEHAGLPQLCLRHLPGLEALLRG